MPASLKPRDPSPCTPHTQSPGNPGTAPRKEEVRWSRQPPKLQQVQSPAGRGRPAPPCPVPALAAGGRGRPSGRPRRRGPSESEARQPAAAAPEPEKKTHWQASPRHRRLEKVMRILSDPCGCPWPLGAAPRPVLRNPVPHPGHPGNPALPGALGIPLCPLLQGWRRHPAAAAMPGRLPRRRARRAGLTCAPCRRRRQVLPLPRRRRPGPRPPAAQAARGRAAGAAGAARPGRAAAAARRLAAAAAAAAPCRAACRPCSWGSPPWLLG
jgi:hypothetical protein